MHKKRYDREEADKKLRRITIRNWIIMLVSLALIIILYYFAK